MSLSGETMLRPFLEIFVDLQPSSLAVYRLAMPSTVARTVRNLAARAAPSLRYSEQSVLWTGWSAMVKAIFLLTRT